MCGSYSWLGEEPRSSGGQQVSHHCSARNQRDEH
uniref:Uncharacterized protein n=1 Tax=Anguilla anguilla TaxID=7936 RepID=A0A0E9XZD4_ANGAN